MTFDYAQERQEAVEAGERALDSLNQAMECLDSAAKWGVFDMLTSGGLLATFAKHSRMSKAESCLTNARNDLQAFARECEDIEQYTEVNLNTDDFLAFADWFFDGIIADWLMQSRINEARTKVSEAIQKVEEILQSI